MRRLQAQRSEPRSLSELPPDALVPPGTMARILGVSVRQLGRLNIPRVVLSPRVTRYRPADVGGWIAQRTQGAA